MSDASPSSVNQDLVSPEGILQQMTPGQSDKRNPGEAQTAASCSYFEGGDGTLPTGVYNPSNLEKEDDEPFDAYAYEMQLREYYASIEDSQSSRSEDEDDIPLLEHRYGRHFESLHESSEQDRAYPSKMRELYREAQSGFAGSVSERKRGRQEPEAYPPDQHRSNFGRFQPSSMDHDSAMGTNHSTGAGKPRVDSSDLHMSQQTGGNYVYAQREQECWGSSQGLHQEIQDQDVLLVQDPTQRSEKPRVSFHPYQRPDIAVDGFQRGDCKEERTPAWRGAANLKGNAIIVQNYNGIPEAFRGEQGQGQYELMQNSLGSQCLEPRIGSVTWFPLKPTTEGQYSIQEITNNGWVHHGTLNNPSTAIGQELNMQGQQGQSYSQQYAFNSQLTNEVLVLPVPYEGQVYGGVAYYHSNIGQILAAGEQPAAQLQAVQGHPYAHSAQYPSLGKSVTNGQYLNRGHYVTGQSSNEPQQVNRHHYVTPVQASSGNQVFQQAPNSGQYQVPQRYSTGQTGNLGQNYCQRPTVAYVTSPSNHNPLQPIAVTVQQLPIGYNPHVNEALIKQRMTQFPSSASVSQTWNVNQHLQQVGSNNFPAANLNGTGAGSLGSIQRAKTCNPQARWTEAVPNPFPPLSLEHVKFQPGWYQDEFGRLKHVSSRNVSYMPHIGCKQRAQCQTSANPTKEKVFKGVEGQVGSESGMAEAAYSKANPMTEPQEMINDRRSQEPAQAKLFEPTMENHHKGRTSHDQQEGHSMPHLDSQEALQEQPDFLPKATGQEDPMKPTQLQEPAQDQSVLEENFVAPSIDDNHSANAGLNEPQQEVDQKGAKVEAAMETSFQGIENRPLIPAFPESNSAARAQGIFKFTQAKSAQHQGHESQQPDNCQPCQVEAQEDVVCQGAASPPQGTDTQVLHDTPAPDQHMGYDPHGTAPSPEPEFQWEPYPQSVSPGIREQPTTFRNPNAALGVAPRWFDYIPGQYGAVGDRPSLLGQSCSRSQQPDWNDQQLYWEEDQNLWGYQPMYESQESASQACYLSPQQTPYLGEQQGYGFYQMPSPAFQPNLGDQMAFPQPDQWSSSQEQDFDYEYQQTMDMLYNQGGFYDPYQLPASPVEEESRGASAAQDSKPPERRCTNILPAYKRPKGNRLRLASSAPPVQGRGGAQGDEDPEQDGENGSQESVIPVSRTRSAPLFLPTEEQSAVLQRGPSAGSPRLEGVGSQPFAQDEYRSCVQRYPWLFTAGYLNHRHWRHMDEQSGRTGIPFQRPPPGSENQGRTPPGRSNKKWNKKAVKQLLKNLRRMETPPCNDDRDQTNTDCVAPSQEGPPGSTPHGISSWLGTSMADSQGLDLRASYRRGQRRGMEDGRRSPDRSDSSDPSQEFQGLVFGQGPRTYPTRDPRGGYFFLNAGERVSVPHASMNTGLQASGWNNPHSIGQERTAIVGSGRLVTQHSGHRDVRGRQAEEARNSDFPSTSSFSARCPRASSVGTEPGFVPMQDPEDISEATSRDGESPETDRPASWWFPSRGGARSRNPYALGGLPREYPQLLGTGAECPHTVRAQYPSGRFYPSGAQASDRFEGRDDLEMTEEQRATMAALERELRRCARTGTQAEIEEKRLAILRRIEAMKIEIRKQNRNQERIEAKRRFLQGCYYRHVGRFPECSTRAMSESESGTSISLEYRLNLYRRASETIASSSDSSDEDPHGADFGAPTTMDHELRQNMRRRPTERLPVPRFILSKMQNDREVMQTLEEAESEVEIGSEDPDPNPAPRAQPAQDPSTQGFPQENSGVAGFEDPHPYSALRDDAQDPVIEKLVGNIYGRGARLGDPYSDYELEDECDSDLALEEFLRQTSGGRVVDSEDPDALRQPDIQPGEDPAVEDNTVEAQGNSEDVADRAENENSGEKSRDENEKSAFASGVVDLDVD